MFTYLLFFAASLALGLSILEILKVYTPPVLKFASAQTIGSTLVLLILFLASFAFGLNFISSFVFLLTILLLSILMLLKSNFAINLEEINFKKNLKLLIPLLFIIGLIAVIFSKSIFVTYDEIVAGNRLIWVDWPIHISFISSFLYGDNFPPQNPQHAGTITTYPFFVEFLSSVLMSLGASLKTALVIPAVVLSSVFILLMYSFGRLFFEKRSIPTVALFVGLFWGGLGFLYFFGDLLSSQNFTGALLFPPHEYTFLGGKNLWFFSFILSELLPQRGFLLGLPMFFTSLMFLILGISKNSKSKILIAGYLTAVMPFFHMHSYISATVMSAAFILICFAHMISKKQIKEAKTFIWRILIYWALPILGFGLIQLPFFLKVGSQAFSYHFGWMAEGENFFVFWIKNTGLFWPLWIFAFVKIKNKLAKYVLLSSLPLFVLPNIFNFAPWPYDNLKILTYWYLIGAFPVAWSINYFWNKRFVFKVLTIIIFISLTLSGFLEIVRILNTQKTQIKLWSQDDIELSKVIIEKTEPQSTILTAAIHDHPVTSLAGRRIVIGFPGNAWSWGFSDWHEREEAVRTMFKGDSLSLTLFKKYDVDYVLISPREKAFEPMLNEDYFDQNFQLTAVGPLFRLYRVE